MAQFFFTTMNAHLLSKSVPTMIATWAYIKLHITAQFEIVQLQSEDTKKCNGLNVYRKLFIANAQTKHLCHNKHTKLGLISVNVT